MSYKLTTNKTWAQTRQDIEECFRKWGIRDWNVIGQPRDRSITVRYVLRGREIRLTSDKEWDSRLNLRRLYLSLDDMRMVEARGLGDVVQEAYLQLAEPKGPRKRDPYEVLGVRPDSPVEVVEASYKALAKKLHPDNGGSQDAFVELQEAYEQLKAVAA